MCILCLRPKILPFRLLPPRFFRCHVLWVLFEHKKTHVKNSASDSYLLNFERFVPRYVFHESRHTRPNPFPKKGQLSGRQDTWSTWTPGESSTFLSRLKARYLLAMIKNLKKSLGRFKECTWTTLQRDVSMFLLSLHEVSVFAWGLPGISGPFFLLFFVVVVALHDISVFFWDLSDTANPFTGGRVHWSSNCRPEFVL